MTRIMYLRDVNYRPVGTLAIVVNHRKNTAEYQLSVLNPVDKFDRKEGRLVALSRLVENPVTVLLPAHASMHEISEAVMYSLAKSKTAPSRAIKGAKLWLRYRSW